MASHTLLRGKLGLDERSWTNKDGSVSTRYRAYIWNSLLKKKTYITLQAENLDKAKEEAHLIFYKHCEDLANGNDISTKRKGLDFFIKKFIQHHTERANNKEKITHKRVEVLGYCLKSLSRFWLEKKKPDLDFLATLHAKEFLSWRREQTALLTGKKISKRTLNNEVQVHKQFYIWAHSNGYSPKLLPTKPPEIDNYEDRTNEPFPEELYRKLLRVAQNDIETTTNTKRKWSKVNYYYLILLMNGIGCRVIECRNLRWKDIRKGKDGKTRVFLHGKNKRRDILIPPRVAEHLERLKLFKKTHGGKLFKWNETSYPYVFNAYKSPRPPKQFDADCRRRWMESAGVPEPKDWELVCFRHKFITDRINDDVLPINLANYCGTSINMIASTYHNYIPEETYNNITKHAPEESLASKDYLPKFLGIPEEETRLHID